MMWDWDTKDLETVGVRRRAGTDADGRPLAYTTPMLPVDGCIVEPLSGAEVLGIANGASVNQRSEVTRTGATSVVRVLLPITAGLDGECELQIRGDWFRIVGGAESFIDDDPELSGYELTCSRGGA